MLDMLMSKAIHGASQALKNLRSITMDVVSSISSTGRTINTVTYNQAERRDVIIITPYGVASSALDDMMVQILVNDMSNRATMIGVDDKNKPQVMPGENVLYSNYGCTISMRSDGQIVFKSQSGKTVTVDELYDHIHP